MHINLTSPEIQQNPYPAYAQMRASKDPIIVSAPITGGDAYFMSRYDDVVKILKDPRFANDQRRLPNTDDWTQKWYIPNTLKLFGDTMALLDEPDHTRLRQLVHKAFTPKMIQQLEGNIRQMTHDLLDKAIASERPVIDFMAEFALPLPLNVICDMIGVDHKDRHKMHHWMADSIANGIEFNVIKILPKLLNTFGMNRFFTKLINSRRQNPQDDLTTALVQAEEAGDKLSERELQAMLFLLLFAGHETTVNLIGNGTLALLQNPDQFTLLKENPELLDKAIEELLRFTNPVHHIAVRYPLEDVEIGSIKIPQHTPVVLGIAAANRDETAFTNANSLDITRSPNKHIAFGFGIHYCIGAPLARLEAKVVFEILFERFPNLQAAVPVEQLEWRGMPALHGLKKFPIRLNPN